MWRARSRRPAALFVWPASSRTKITALRMVASTWGAAPVRMVDASSLKVTSRMLCCASMLQCPRLCLSRSRGVALVLLRLVTPVTASAVRMFGEPRVFRTAGC